MFNRSVFAVRVRELRLTANMTMDEVAAAIGLKRRASISLFEAGKNVPSIEGFTALAELFAVSMDYLAGRSDDIQREVFILQKEKNLLSTLPAEFSAAYQAAKEKNPENVQQIIETFEKIAEEYHSLSK